MFKPAVRGFSRPLCRTPILSRAYAVQTAGSPTVEVFSNSTKWLQKERAAGNAQTSREVDYLRTEVASRLCDRLFDIKRDFENVLDLGANSCQIARILTELRPEEQNVPSENDHGNTAVLSTRIGQVTATEHSETSLYRDADLPFNAQITIDRQIMQSPETLPYDANTFDAVLSSLSLHWINDLPSVLKQINQVLKPDSPFLGVMFGGDSLYELRTSLQLAEMDRRGGVSTHTSPLADVRDMGGLLQQAGFNLLTVDVDDIVIDYPDVFALMKDLQAMGESNAVLGREAAGLRRDVLAAADAIYRELHGNEDGSVPATFRILYMIGWKKHESQAKPLERGSGMVSIKDVLEGRQNIKKPE